MRFCSLELIQTILLFCLDKNLVFWPQFTPVSIILASGKSNPCVFITMDYYLYCFSCHIPLVGLTSLFRVTALNFITSCLGKKNRSWCFCLPSSLIQFSYNIEFYTSPLPDCVWFEYIMQWWSFFRQLIVWRDFTTAQSTNRDMIFECMLQIQWCVFVLIGKEFTSNILF